MNIDTLGSVKVKINNKEKEVNKSKQELHNWYEDINLRNVYAIENKVESLWSNILELKELYLIKYELEKEGIINENNN